MRLVAFVAFLALGASSLLSGCGGCPTGQFQCGQLCITLGTDPLNCGSCGNVCGAGRTCTAGVCGTSCAVGYSDCGGTCHDLTADRANCGACGKPCGAGEVCNMGACGTSCSATLSPCMGVCRDLMADVSNCGACGNKCEPGKVCSQGSCGVSCLSGTMNCLGNCRDVLSDVNNCGGCGMKCDPGSACSAGKCMVSCQSSLTNCNGVCRDLSSDPANCGGCDSRCAAGNVCDGGKCALSCTAPLQNCNGGCKDLTVDPGNCGACGMKCGANQACAAGKCTTTCAMGQTVCQNACTSLAIDPLNCGGCGKACGGNGMNATAVCVNSACALYCARGFLDCDGMAQNGCEVAYASDPANCGSCGVICPSGGNSKAVCKNAQCALQCGPGFNDCNGIPGDGCESNSQTDAANCNGCGNVCVGGPHGSGACVAGACGLACDMGFADCNMKAMDGCETGTATDVANCGKCGNVCAMGQVCSAGMCTFGFLGSSLITPQQGTQINQWIGNANQSWSLCYHMGAGGKVDGTSTQTFHARCDNRGPTVTIASLNSGAQLMGGYASQSWNQSCNYFGDSNSFLFSLTNSFKHAWLQYSYYLYTCNGNYGPTWGGGHDFSLAPSTNVIGTGAYCNLGHTYNCRVGTYGSAQCQNDLCGRYQPAVDDVEVYVQYGK
jgi:hypothetical protein